MLGQRPGLSFECGLTLDIRTPSNNMTQTLRQWIKGHGDDPMAAGKSIQPLLDIAIEREIRSVELSHDENRLERYQEQAATLVMHGDKKHERVFTESEVRDMINAMAEACDLAPIHYKVVGEHGIVALGDVLRHFLENLLSVFRKRPSSHAAGLGGDELQ